MSGDLAALSALPREALWSGALVFLRVGAVMALLPVFGEQVVPARVRLALALAFTAIVAPVVGVGRAAPPGLAAAGVEVIAGLALGLVMRTGILALQTAGQVAAQAISLAQIFAGAGVDPMPAMGRLALVAGLALAAMAGLHLAAAEAMILSYRVIPPGALPDAGMLAEWGVGHVAAAFEVAITLAMPFLIGALIYNLALGVINRAMPQLMVVLIGAPALTAGGMILLGLALPVMLDLWRDWLMRVIADPFAAGPR